MVGATPFEAAHGHKPNVSHLRFFGSKAWDRIPMDKRKAFQSQISECIMLGYAEDAKEYNLWNLQLGNASLSAMFGLKKINCLIYHHPKKKNV